MYRTDCDTAHPVLLNRLSKVNTSCGPAGRSSFISGELKDGWDSICLWLTGALSWPPQNATLDSKRTFSWFVSYRRLSAQFQFSLSADTLGYLSQWQCFSSLRCTFLYCRVLYWTVLCTQPCLSSEAEFLTIIGTKVFRVFAIHSHLY